MSPNNVNVIIDLLVQCIADTHKEYVREISAKKIWNKLETTYERKGTSSSLYQLEKLISMKFVDDELIKIHFTHADDLDRLIYQVEICMKTRSYAFSS